MIIFFRISNSRDFESNRITFKVVVVGNAVCLGVGKSCLIQKYTTKEFQENYQMTIGMDFVSKTVEVSEEASINLQIWDTAGQEVFKSLVKSFYKGAAGIILVYSIVDVESFQMLNSWASEINENVPDSCLKILIGAQNDREKDRKVPYEEGLKFKSDYNFQLFYETSAMTGQNVDEAFEEAAKDIYKIQMEKLQSTGVQQRQSIQVRNVRNTLQNESLNLDPDMAQQNNNMHSHQIEKKSCC